jgi:preprotein translocase subunit SecD
MKKAIALFLAAALAGCATTECRKAAVTLQIRPGSQSPGPGLTKMVVSGSDTSVYVADDVLLSNTDIKSARVAAAQDGPQIEIVFTEAGARRFADVTETNLMKQLVILVDGKVISAPIVRDRIPGGRAVITGAFSEEEARRIADGIAAGCDR